LTSTGTGLVEWLPNGETTNNITVNPSNTTIYSVSTTNNCGTVSTDVEVVVNPLPAANAGNDQTICAGESVTLTASGGQDYSWNSGANTASISDSPTQSTTYQVLVTDANNCSASDEVEVFVNQLPVADAGNDQAICQGETATLSASGGDTYSWNIGETASSVSVSPTETSTYEVLVIDGNGCLGADEVEVIVNPIPAQPTISVNVAELESTLGSSYQWYLNGIAIEGATNQTYSPTEAGDYTVEVFDGNGCSSTSEPFIWITVGISEHASGFSVYPNPMNTVFTIKGQNTIAQLLIYDAQGRLVMEQSPNISTVVVPISELANGIYQLHILSGENWFSEKLIKQSF